MTRREIIDKLVEGGKMLPFMTEFEAEEVFDFIVTNLAENYQCDFSLQFNDKSTLPKQAIQGLDEAAETYAENILANGEDMFDAIADGFKAGAKWMAEQGYTKEETVYFERLCDENRIMVDLGWGEPERGGFNPGDKVVVQIRKK